MTETDVFACPRCQAQLQTSALNTGLPSDCVVCGTALQVEVFPALFRTPVSAQTGEVALLDSESSCFYHPQKKAVVPCDACGRFLCSLCDVDLAGQHLCPSCIETGKRKGTLAQLDTQRFAYDSLALSLAGWPVILFPVFFWVTPITALLALYYALRYWGSPTSIVHPTRRRYRLALLLAGLQLLAWLVFPLMYYLGTAMKDVVP